MVMYYKRILFGSPGSGKTMLAKRLITILPSLTLNEAIEISKIYSCAGLLNKEQPLILRRPFRTPHHTSSTASLIGGGRIPKPGEVSLATGGILFLDEMAEYKKDVLEALRQPIEDRKVTISRSSATLTYPSNFMLIGSYNPCPCGFYGDEKKECICTPYQIKKYRSKISGPLLDRIDIKIEVQRLSYNDIENKSKGESSKVIRERVERARLIQNERLSQYDLKCNAEMSNKLVRKFCEIDKETKQVLKQAFERFGLSMRAHDRILKVARTIADLNGNDNISIEHIMEAMQFRLD